VFRDPLLSKGIITDKQAQGLFSNLEDILVRLPSSFDLCFEMVFLRLSFTCIIGIE